MQISIINLGLYRLYNSEIDDIVVLNTESHKDQDGSKQSIVKSFLFINATKAL